MDSDESTTSRGYDSPRRRSHHISPREILEDDISENTKLMERRRLLLEKLPSPREFQTPPQEDIPLQQERKPISISDLNPFFDELDASSSTSSLVDEVEIDDAAELAVDPGETLIHSTNSSSGSRKELQSSICRRTSSFRRIWSSLGSSSLPGLPAAVSSKSQDTNSSSSSSSKGDGLGITRKSIKRRLKNMSHKVRKQLSVTSDFIVDKFSKHAVKSDSSFETFPPGDEDTQTNRKAISDYSVHEIPQPANSADKTNVSRSESDEIENFKNSEIISECKETNDFEYYEPAKLIWNIPNWMDNPVVYENGLFSLEDQINEEKVKMAEKHPIELAESVEYLRKSVGRDFRRGYLVLGEKMQLPNLQAVRCLKFSQFHNHSFLAIGCEEGTLLILELDYQKPLHQLLKSEESLQSLLYQVPLRSKCRIQMNETLVGHAYDLKCIVWNNANGKLLTSDEAGVIIGWGFGENGCWVEEIINDRSTSRICDMAWSPNGKKIVIGYEDFAGNGKMTGGVIVGLADGTQIFDRKFADSPINAVAWFSDSVVWAVVDFTLYSFDENGEIGKIYRSIDLGSGTAELVEFIIKPKSSWITTESTPEFLVVYKESCMTLYNSFVDKAPLRIHTQLTATCADWSANGVYIVVGGMPVGANDEYFSPQINLYNYEGKLLQILKIHEQCITSVTWAHDSLHLTLASERHIYFANLRPMYKISSCNSVHCYAYRKDYVNQWISFWNDNAIFKEIIPGKVIDIKSCNDKFSVLCMDTFGVYHIFVFGETGVKQHHLCVITMEPFALTMTKNSVICLAPNAILNWNFNLFSGEGSKKFTGALKTTRQVHIDEFPGIIVKPGEKQDHLLKPAIDCARCIHAMRDRLCVARESGKLQIYAMPTLGFLQAYRLDLNGDICQEIKFNSDGTQLALLTMNGHLRICRFPEARERRKEASYCGQEVQLLYCDNLTSVSGIIWATDMLHHLCVIEGNSIHFLQDDQVIETISNIPSGCYLTDYEGLYVTLIYMDKVIENPENPSSKMIIKLALPSLSRIYEAMEHGDCMEDIVSILASLPYSHPVLRKAVGDEALRQGLITLAESIYTEDKNYRALRFMEKIKESELELQKAQIHCFLSEYEQAQHYFIRAGKKNLAIKMWKELGDWEKVSFLSGYNSEDGSTEALEYQYEKFKEANDWEMALEISFKLESAERIIEACVMLEDYGKMTTLMEKLPPRDPALRKMGALLASEGLVEEAAYCFSSYGDPETAMKIAVETRHWDLAMKLSRVHNLSLIQPALVKHIKGLIEANNLNPAIQVLDRCGKVITAGKLLIWKGLRMLQHEACDTMEVKKIFVLAAKMLSKKKCRRKKGTVQTLGESDELDLEYLIPNDHLEIMIGHNEWCWNDPWRAAEAVHFLNLAQRFIYRGMMGRAFKAAMYLRKFEDIIGSERINCLVALTAISNGYFKVASNALLKLEAENEDFSEISFNLFKDHSPKNHDVHKFQCAGCEENIPDFYASCPLCNMKFIMCIFSACPIPNVVDMWTCQTCFRSVQNTKRDRFDYCLLCHSQI